MLDDCATYLTVQAGIVSFACGVPDADLNREVNDRDFHVGLHLLFESRAAHDAYQVDEQHDIFIERNRENWAQVRVFDTAVKSQK